MSDDPKKQDPEAATEPTEISEEALEKVAAGLRMTPLSQGGATSRAGMTLQGVTVQPSGYTIQPLVKKTPR